MNEVSVENDDSPSDPGDRHSAFVHEPADEVVLLCNRPTDVVSLWMRGVYGDSPFLEPDLPSGIDGGSLFPVSLWGGFCDCDTGTLELYFTGILSFLIGKNLDTNDGRFCG